MNTNLIYVLYDPRNDTPMYVGKTTIGIDRPIMHLHYSHNHNVREWTSELNKLGYSPIVKIIEKNIELCLLSDREKYWIREYCSINPDLLNILLMPQAKDEIRFEINKNELLEASKFLNNIPTLLKSLKYLTKMNQEEIAKELNISLGTIKRIENGKNIGIDILCDLINGAIKLIDKTKSD